MAGCIKTQAAQDKMTKLIFHFFGQPQVILLRRLVPVHTARTMPRRAARISENNQEHELTTDKAGWHG